MQKAKKRAIRRLARLTPQDVSRLEQIHNSLKYRREPHPHYEWVSEYEEGLVKTLADGDPTEPRKWSQVEINALIERRIGTLFEAMKHLKNKDN